MTTQTVLEGNVFDLLPTLKPGSVDCIVTSPPYWKLRSYLPKDHPLKSLELGSEPTPQEFAANLVRVFRGVRIALADHGTVWLNIGDTYAGGGRGGDSGKGTCHSPDSPGSADIPGPDAFDSGSLCLIPQRLAIALADDSWLVRSVVVWHKPACMPASLAGWSWRRCRKKVKPRGACPEVKANGQPGGIDSRTDAAVWEDCPGCAKCLPNDGLVLRRGSWRPTSSWEPILMLAKRQGYFADGEPVKTPAAPATRSRDKYTRVLDDPDEQLAVRHDHETLCESGANLRDVWTIASEPLHESHYAAFPTQLVRRCLLAGTSQKGYCPTCGAPWARVLEKESAGKMRDRAAGGLGTEQRRSPRGLPPVNGEFQEGVSTKTLGWRPTCNCIPLDPRPAMVLDPFAGSGRVGVACRRLGLDFIGFELNPQYAKIARRQIAGALREDVKRARKAKSEEPDLFAGQEV